MTSTDTTSELPAFFTDGLAISVDGNSIETNIPGLVFDEEAGVEVFGHQLAKFILCLYHPNAGHLSEVVEEFYNDCVAELMVSGGCVPHASARDWLHFHGHHNKIVDD